MINDQQTNNKKKKNNLTFFNKRQIKKLLFFLLVFLFPTQFGKHFFFDFSYLSGIKTDYLAPTIYLTDILVISLIPFYLQPLIKFFKKPKIIFLLFLLITNLFFSINPWITFYRFLKIIEFLIVFVIIAFTFIKQDKELNKLLIFAFFLSSIFELLLASFQFIYKRSLQGIFYFFGERYFTLSTPNIAKSSLNGVEILRPYGTFSHPNSLGGFYLLLYFFVLTNKQFNQRKIIKTSLLFIATFLILLSFSKIVIFTFLILNLYYFVRFSSKKELCKLCSVARGTILTVLSLLFLSVHNDPLTIKKRIELIKNAFQIILKRPLLGVGLGNYTISQNQLSSNYYFLLNQPVHNIFLLFTAEVGIIMAGLIFIWIVYHLKIGFKKPSILFIFLIILITGSFDHYWLTLQQNWLLFSFTVGYGVKKFISK